MAGAIFGMEVLAIGRIRYDALFPCLVAAVLADQVCLAWGVHHTHYRIDIIPAFTMWSFLSVVIAGAVFGLAGMVFSVATGKSVGSLNVVLSMLLCVLFWRDTDCCCRLVYRY
jgi:H+/Cl- antiporter ClcA